MMKINLIVLFFLFVTVDASMYLGNISALKFLLMLLFLKLRPYAEL